MKVAVCIKQVPPRDGPVSLDKSAAWIHEKDTSFEVNEADTYALEEGLKIKEQQGGEVLLISLGPDRVVSVLKDGLAKGADRAIHVKMESCSSLQPNMLADIIGSVLQEERPDLVLMGMQSDDRGNGQLAPNLARALGMPHATLVAEVVVADDGLRLKRELEGGRLEEIAILLPCVLGIQTGINKPRYAGMKGIMSAKKKKIDYRTMDDMSRQIESGGELLTRIYVPMKSKTCRMLDGNDAAAVDDLVTMLNTLKV